MVLRLNGLERPCLTTERTKCVLHLEYENGVIQERSFHLPPGLWRTESDFDTATEARLRLAGPNGLYPTRILLNGRQVYARGPGDPAPKQAGFSTIMHDLARVNAALLAYYDKYKTLPPGAFAQATDSRGRYNPEWIQGLVPEFLPELPRDPRGVNDPARQYMYCSDTMAFKLLVHGAPDGYRVRYASPGLGDPRRADAYGYWLPAAAGW